MSVYGYSGSSYDRFVENTNTSTLHKMKETYWTTKQAVIKKLGKKEDEHVVASDSQLDAKLEVFKAIQKSSMDLLRVIERYQERLCVVSQEENTMGRLLKAHSNKDKTRAGKMMAAVGKAESNSAQERLALHNPLRRLYQEVETFRYRAVSDTLVTINRMESARTEYRGALLWMKNISEELDPDMYKQLEKFRKVQGQVRKTKSRFDKLKLDVMQKVDLLAASRCNMYSHVLANYQTMLLHYWEKTSRTLSAVAESFKGYQYYEFNMLKELTETSRKLALDSTKEPAEKDTEDGDDNELLDDDEESHSGGRHSKSSKRRHHHKHHHHHHQQQQQHSDLGSPSHSSKTSSPRSQSNSPRESATTTMAVTGPSRQASNHQHHDDPRSPWSGPALSHRSTDYWKKASGLSHDGLLGETDWQEGKQEADQSVDDLLSFGDDNDDDDDFDAVNSAERSAVAAIAAISSGGNDVNRPSASTSTIYSYDQDYFNDDNNKDEGKKTTMRPSQGFDTRDDSENGSLISVEDEESKNARESLAYDDKLLDLGLGGRGAAGGSSDFGPFTDASSTSSKKADDDLLKDDEDDDLDFAGKIMEAAAKNREIQKVKPDGKPKDLLGDDQPEEEFDIDKDDMTLLNEILNAPSQGEDEFTTEWTAVFGGGTLTHSSPDSVPAEPDLSKERSGFLPSSLLETQMIADPFSSPGPSPSNSRTATEASAGLSSQQSAPGKAGKDQKSKPPPLTKQGPGTNMSAWFNLFADLDPLSNPDAIGRRPDDMTDAM